MENHKLDINKRYKNVSKTWDNEVNLKRVGNKSNTKLVGHKPVDDCNVFKNSHVTVDGEKFLTKKVPSKLFGEVPYDRDPFSLDSQQKFRDDLVDGFVAGGIPRKFFDDTNLPKDVANNCLADIELKLDETVYVQSAISSFDSSNSIEMVDHPTNLDKVFDKMEDEKHSLETNDVYDWTKPHPLSIDKEKSKKDYSENFRKRVEELERTNKIKKSLAKGLTDILEDEVEELDEGQSWLKDSLLGIGEHINIISEPSKLDSIEKAPQYNSEVFPEVIVMMEDNFKIIATMCFAKLNSFKYRMRTGLKDVKKIEEDIKKAMNYESRYKVFLQKMKSIFYKDKVLPLIIGDETFEMKVVGDDYEQEIKNIKLYLEKYATETK